MIKPSGLSQKNLIDGFFSNLEALKNKLENADTYTEELIYAEDPQEAHEIIDFYGTVMAHILMRTFPLNHPVMWYCLDHMETLEDAPDNIIRASQTPNFVTTSGNMADDVWALYNEREPGLLPQQGQSRTYKQAKLMQLIELSPRDAFPHIPIGENDSAGRRYRDVARALGLMVSGVAEDTGFHPARKPAQKKPQ